MLQMTGLGIEQPLRFSLSLHLTSLQQVYAEQWRGAGASLWGYCLWVPGHSRAEPPLTACDPQGTSDNWGRLSHTGLMLQYYSPSTEPCFIHTDVCSYFDTAVLHIWRLTAGQRLFCGLNPLFHSEICFTSCCLCTSHYKKMFGGKFMYKP